MKIKATHPVSQDGWTNKVYTLSSDTKKSATHDLSISVPDAYSGWISDRMEAPVLAALFPAMTLGEPIRVDQPLSERFHYGLRQVMQYFHLWYPDQLSIVDIECAGWDLAEKGNRNTVGCFSGGVDSFYTLLHHQEQMEPITSYQMTHGLFVQGFDISIGKQAFYDGLADTYEEVLQKQGVQLVRCRTNLRTFLDSYQHWMTTHGIALNMVAHFLSNGISRFVIPSTNRFSLINPPIGSNPITDPQPASESLEIIHHGCEASRIEKVLAISEIDAAQQHLRVCFKDIKSGINCGKCNKCHKVMLPLWVAGKLDSFNCFPDHFSPKTVSSSCFDGIDVNRYAPEKSYGEELGELAAAYSCDLARAVPALRSKVRVNLYHKLKALFR